MVKDTIKGKLKQAKGQVKATTGRITGNMTLENKGKIEKAAGKVQVSKDKLKRDLRKSGTNKDMVKGEFKQAKGQAKATIGRITGNKTLENKGKIEKAGGKVQESFGKLKKEVKDRGSMDVVKGQYKQAKGQVKETTGRITGNMTLENKGKIEKVAGKIQEGYGNLKKKITK